MDNLLDKTGVKRLLNNIKDWVEDKFIDIEDKFIDVDDREYYPWEIQYLVSTNQLKPGKQYKIYYNYENNISYKNNIYFLNPFFVPFIVLRAVNENTFSNNATYFNYVNKAYPCIFDYGNNKYSNYTTGLYVSKINYNKDYWLHDIYNFNSSDKIIMFISGNDKIYVKFDKIKKAITGNTIDIFLDEDCTIGAQGIYYYNGLGTITYIKDNKDNEASFDFINLGINNKTIITGNNNIIKGFDPENPIFINGDNNIIINSQNLNIEEDNVVYVNNVKQNTKQDIIDLLAYGVEWDITQDDPDCKRIGNLELHKTLPITSGFRGCVYRKDVSKLEYLAEDDFSVTEDGEPTLISNERNIFKIDTGADFYLKSEEDGNKRRVWVSQIQIDSSWKKIKRCLIDMFRCAEYEEELQSVTAKEYGDNIKPATGIRRGVARTKIYNNEILKNGYLLDYNTYKAVFYWLPVIEYATFNLQQNFTSKKTIEGYLQGGLGPGLTNLPDGYSWDTLPILPCGYNIYNGVYTSEDYYYKYINDIEYEFTFCSWRGFEQPFGDIWTNLDGIIIKYNSDLGKNEVFICDEPEYFSDELNDHYYKIGEEIASNGYIKEFDLGEHAEIIPESIGGSAVTGKCDYNYTNTNSNLKTLLGGGAVDGSGAGLGCFDSGSGVDYYHSHVGFRTVHYID